MLKKLQIYLIPNCDAIPFVDTENAQLQENLAELACEINIKQRLIEELEHSQRRLQAMKVHYEEKLGSLLTRIKETESERDKVLENLGMYVCLSVCQKLGSLLTGIKETESE